MVKSTWDTVILVVPQGSVLVPLLCIICINDIKCLISSNINKFANDTKSGRIMLSKEGSIALQEDYTTRVDKEVASAV